MKKNYSVFVGLVVLVTFVLACQRVPLTGRKQMVGLVSGDQMMAMSFQQYKGFLDSAKQVPANKAEAQMVARVGERILAVNVLAAPAGCTLVVAISPADDS
jgi:hypothetical protein